MCFVLLAVADQASTGSLRGVARDGSGGTIPGLEIVASSSAGDIRRVITNSQGEFLFETLPAGTWQVTARFAGFRTERVDVRIVAGGAAEWNVVLRIPFTPAVPQETPPAGLDTTPPEDSREMYSLIADYVRKRSGTLAVHEKSLAPPLRDIDDWLTELGPAWDEMRQAITSKTHALPVTLRAESLPAGTAFRDERQIFETHLNRAGTLESLHLSKVLLAPDGQAAVVAYWYSCGNLCGNGTLAFLRKRPDGRWSIAVQKTLVIS
jgi:hypothetical protein